MTTNGISAAMRGSAAGRIPATCLRIDVSSQTDFPDGGRTPAVRVFFALQPMPLHRANDATVCVRSRVPAGVAAAVVRASIINNSITSSGMNLT